MGKCACGISSQRDKGREAEMIVWSYGGGTQSIAIALLVVEGKLPRPDLIVMADTDLETTETWEYLWKVILPMLYEYDPTLEFHIAPHDLAKVGMYSKKGDLLIPAYTQDGKLPTFCSSEWKTRVVRRYLRSLGVEKCDMWLGMSTDEIERLKPADVNWIQHVWPLVGMPRSVGYGVQMNRRDCVQYIANQGKPEPPKSCCVICPHRRNPQWQRQKLLYPADHRKAVAIGKVILENDLKSGHSGVWLHEDRKPLDEIDFSKTDTREGLFGAGCQTSGSSCWT
jgi:hypothetical protein